MPVLPAKLPPVVELNCVHAEVERAMVWVVPTDAMGISKTGGAADRLQIENRNNKKDMGRFILSSLNCYAFTSCLASFCAGCFLYVCILSACSFLNCLLSHRSHLKADSSA